MGYERLQVGSNVRAKIKTLGHDKEIVGKIMEIDRSDATAKVNGMWVDLKYCFPVDEACKARKYWL